MAEELRALNNSALLGDAEFHDAARFEKLRLAWERRPYPKKKQIAIGS
jgi:hypothetical protein